MALINVTDNCFGHVTYMDYTDIHILHGHAPVSVSRSPSHLSLPTKLLLISSTISTCVLAVLLCFSLCYICILMKRVKEVSVEVEILSDKVTNCTDKMKEIHCDSLSRLSHLERSLLRSRDLEPHVKEMICRMASLSIE